jgi:hypothetical protein
LALLYERYALLRRMARVPPDAGAADEADADGVVVPLSAVRLAE